MSLPFFSCKCSVCKLVVTLGWAFSQRGMLEVPQRGMLELSNCILLTSDDFGTALILLILSIYSVLGEIPALLPI
jgi:hypothetical protein